LRQLFTLFSPITAKSHKNGVIGAGFDSVLDYKVWKSIPTNKGELRDPQIDKNGRATALSDHTEVEVLQAIVSIERWKAARRSAGSKRAAITRKNNKHALEYFSEKLAEAKLLSEDGSTLELNNLRAVVGSQTSCSHLLRKQPPTLNSRRKKKTREA